MGALFALRNGWKPARWAKLRGKGSHACDDLLAIPRVRGLSNYHTLASLLTLHGDPESLDLPYRSSRQLDRTIDRQLPSRPKCAEIVMQSEAVEMYSRLSWACRGGVVFSQPHESCRLCRWNSK